jgi:hypothetical protein
VLSLGNHAVRLDPWLLPARAMPWHWLARLPLLSQLVPNRFSVIADGAAAVVLAFAIDRAWSGIPATRSALRLAVAGVLAIALVPVIPVALETATVSPLTAGWATAVSRLRLPAGAPVLMLPVNDSRATWQQAATGARYSVVGGFCIAPLPSGQAAGCGGPRALTVSQLTTIRLLDRLALGRPAAGPRPAMMLAALRSWRPAAVLSPVDGRRGLRRYLISFFGPPAVHAGSVLGWRLGAGWQHRLPS